jgi:hypothetical protein
MIQPDRTLKPIDKTIRKFANVAELEGIKALEYRYRQSRPVHEGCVRDEGRGFVRFERAPR